MIHDALSRMTQEMITLDTEVLLTLSVGFLCKSLFSWLSVHPLTGWCDELRSSARLIGYAKCLHAFICYFCIQLLGQFQAKV